MPITLEYDARPIPIDKFKRALLFYVNGMKYEVSNAQPTMTLLEWLRANGLTGTKLGCSEGGCGACTVMISKRDLGSGEIRHFAANACLMPLCAADWCAVTTVEGIGSNKPNSKLHPVQERMTALHGSQCGFSTPGFVMSMLALYLNDPAPTRETVLQSLAGLATGDGDAASLLESIETDAFAALRRKVYFRWGQAKEMAKAAGERR